MRTLSRPRSRDSPPLAPMLPGVPRKAAPLPLDLPSEDGSPCSEGPLASRRGSSPKPSGPASKASRSGKKASDRHAPTTCSRSPRPSAVKPEIILGVDDKTAAAALLPPPHHGPVGLVGKTFGEVRTLPRHQQLKVVELVQVLLDQFKKEAG
jgi:hypothetical protein